jgi:hypothetical protein
LELKERAGLLSERDRAELIASFVAVGEAGILVVPGPLDLDNWLRAYGGPREEPPI